jgi:hypothetical protein
VATLVASFSLPAWATWAANIFSQYAPLSWVVAGFCGVLAWVIIRVIWNWAYQISVRAEYDAKFIEHGGNFNPLDSTFERKRIFVNDFVLPSHPYIENKTFIDCDIIGPANLYFYVGNQMSPVKPPPIDAVCLDPTKKFSNGFLFSNCIFRNCSFQRITLFVSQPTYEDWKNNPLFNWISPPPPPPLPLPETPQPIEGKPE